MGLGLFSGEYPKLCVWDLIHAVFTAHLLNRFVVRHQSFWFQRQRNLREYQAHLVGFIMRRSYDVASAGFQVFCV
jgi:hypothetical protein